MKHYLLLRLVAMVPTLFGALLLCFCILNLLPGGPIEAQISQWNSVESAYHAPLVTQEIKDSLKQYYGFDLPLTDRFFAWLKKILVFDMGISFSHSRPVLALIQEALPVSFSLGLCSLFLTHLISIPLGLGKAFKESSQFDMASSLLLLVAYALPPFVLATWSFSLFPITGIVSENFSEMASGQKLIDLTQHLALPVLCYSLSHLATSTFLLKHSLQEELGREYVLVAKAKGLSRWEVMKRHLLRNAILPIANGTRDWLTYFFAGSLMVEVIFDLRGIGRLSYHAVLQRDYPVILGIIWFLSLAQMIGNFLGDCVLTCLDPRLRWGKSSK